MSKARIIGAGTAGSTNYNCNVNLNTGGGPKKQGFPWSMGTPSNIYPIMNRSLGNNRNVIFTMNQLGCIV